MKKIKISFLLSLILFFTLGQGYCLDLKSIKSKMLLGDFNSALTEAEALITKDSSSSELYYLLGLCYLKAGDYLRASEIFEIIIKEFSGTKFKEEAQIGLGDAYFLRGDLQKAEINYREVINKNPQSKLKSEVYYRLSEVAFKKGDNILGQEYLKKVNDISLYSLEVKQGFSVSPRSNNVSYYSVQVGSFSKFTNANNFVGKLITGGYPAFIEELQSPVSKIYRVKVGKLATRKEADKLSKKLAQEGYPTKICP